MFLSDNSPKGQLGYKAYENMNYKRILQTVMERVASKGSNTESRRKNLRKEYNQVARSILKIIKEERSNKMNNKETSKKGSGEIASSSQVFFIPTDTCWV